MSDKGSPDLPSLFSRITLFRPAFYRFEDVLTRRIRDIRNAFDLEVDAATIYEDLFCVAEILKYR
jgi:hypothetical protein